MVEVEPAAGALAVRRVRPSATLAADERVRGRIASGIPVLHLAFGEAGLPVPPGLVDVLARAAADNRYGPVEGSLAARAAAAGYFGRRGLPTGPEQVVFAPGSKALLFALLSVLPGDVLLPLPSWVSYAAQAELAGKRVWPVAIGQAGGLPSPPALVEAITTARAAGSRPGVLVVTLPDNPTGTVAPPGLVREVAGLAGEHELTIVSDEIYRDLAFEPGLSSPAEFLAERTFVTSGLSKSMALGGWRIGFARFPPGDLGTRVRAAVTGLASEVWSSLAAPMQHVAAYVLGEPAEVRAHVEASMLLHRRTSLALHDRLLRAGVDCRRPGGAFYLYPDLEPLRPRLAALGVGGGDDLAELLLERHDVAVLSGTAFGDLPTALRFRLATSLLYGRTDEERRQALASDDPVGLPWIGGALDRIDAVLASLTDG
jgi:aspartate aminotransferase